MHVELAGRPYTLDAAAGTFTPGAVLTVVDAPPVPGPATFRTLAPAVQLSTPQATRGPVTLTTTAPQDVDLGTTVAAFWQPGSDRVLTAPLRRLDDGRLQAELPGLGALALLAFPTPEAMAGWLGAAWNGFLDTFRDLVDFPCECPPAMFSSSLVELGPSPPDALLQVDVSDADVASRQALITTCNRTRFATSLTVTGAASDATIALPRSTMPLTEVLDGRAGDPLTVTPASTPSR